MDVEVHVAKISVFFLVILVAALGGGGGGGGPLSG